MSSPITDDIFCVTCNYNLRMLTAADNCPECGSAVGPSIEWSRNVASDPRWIGNIRTGLILLLIAAGLAIASTPTVGPMVMGSPVWALGLMFVAQVLALWSAWLIAAREPRREDPPLWRVGLVVLGVVTTAPNLLAIVLHRAPGVIGPVSGLAAMFAWIGAGATLLYFVRLSQIARRFQWKRAAVFALVVGFGLCAATILGLIIFEFRRRTVASAAFMPITGGGLPSVILPVILLLRHEDVTDAWQFWAWLTQPIFLMVSWGLFVVLLVKLRRLSRLGAQ